MSDGDDTPDATPTPDDDDDAPRPDDEAAAVAGGPPDDDGDGDQDHDDLPTIKNPDDHAEGAFRRALDALENAPDDVIEGVKAEKNAVDDFARDVAAAQLHGLPEQHAAAYASKLKDEADVYNKSDIISRVADRRKEIRAEHPGYGRSNGGGNNGSAAPEYPPLDVWVDDHLEKVVVLETTDANQDTTYRWHFGDEGVVETGANAEGITHFAWNYYRDEVYQALGVNTTKPERKEAEEWRQWIAHLVETRGVQQTSVGARSHAVEELQRYIEDAVGYTDLADAAERGGVHVKTTGGASGSSSASGGGGGPDGDADDADATDAAQPDADGATGGATAADGGPSTEEVRVLYPDIARICEDAGIEVRGLQSELDARDHTHPRIAGVSESESVRGSDVRYWVFKPGLAEPETVVDDPQSPAAQAAYDDDPAAAPPGAGGGGTGTPQSGHLGGIGPSPDADNAAGDDASPGAADSDDAPDATDTPSDATDGRSSELSGEKDAADSETTMTDDTTTDDDADEPEEDQP